jgi:hypothetical protein
MVARSRWSHRSRRARCSRSACRELSPDRFNRSGAADRTRAIRASAALLAGGARLGHLGHAHRIVRSVETVEYAGASRSNSSPRTRWRSSATVALGSPAGVGTELHVVPGAGPAAAPAHRPAAGHAGLAGQGGLVAAKGGGGWRLRQFAGTHAMQRSERECNPAPPEAIVFAANPTTNCRTIDGA